MENNIILYTTIDGRIKVELYEMNDNIWLPQRAIAELFEASKSSISEHIKHILIEKELVEESVVRNFRTTASDGKTYNIKFYSIEMILAVGFRVRSKRGVQFRIWANEHLKKYLQKGFLLDNDRLKNPNGRTDYFDELLEQIRDIRASEKRFYQKVRDLFALSIDYDSNDKILYLEFLAYTLKYIIPQGEGSTIPQLIIPNFKQIKIPIPPLEVQKEIVSILEERFEVMVGGEFK